MNELLAKFPGRPWLAWLVLCVCRQRAKQTWLLQVAPTLKGENGPIARLPGWRASFHGSGLILVGPGDDSVEMDFGDALGRVIDPYFFAWRVWRFKTPPGPEAELRRWLPSIELLNAGLDVLRAEGQLLPPKSHRFSLSEPLEALHAQLAALELEGAALDEVRAPLEARGEVPGGAAHVAWLGSILEDRFRGRACFEGIAAALPRPELLQRLPALLSKPDDLAGEAIDWCRHAGVDVDALVVPLLARLDPLHAHPFILLAICNYLLARGVEAGLALGTLEAFASREKDPKPGGNAMVERVAFSLLEHGSTVALRSVREALRYSPLSSEQLASFLALVDAPWAHAELLSLALDAQCGSELRRRGALGLCASAWPEVRETGVRTLPPLPRRDPRAIGYTFEEVDAVQLAREGLPEVPQEQRALAERLRHTAPVEPRRQ